MEIEGYEYEGRGPMGFKLLEESHIKCADCGKKLVEIIKVKDEDRIVKNIKAQCPYCDGESFVFRVTGFSYIQAVEPLSIEDMPTEFEEDGTMHITVEMIK